MEGPLHTARAVGIADLVRHETKPHALCERRHLGYRFHLLAAAAQHHHVRVVDHCPLWRATHITQRFGEKGLAIEALKPRGQISK